MGDYIPGSTNSMTRHVNTCNILISLPSHQTSNSELILDYKITNLLGLPSCQISNSEPILDYKTTNLLGLPSNINIEDISQEASNNSKEKIKQADIVNNKEDIRLADIDKERPATPN